MTQDNFKGAPYPLEKHPKGYFHTQNGIDQIKSDMLSLILTNQGERIMLPTFGVDLRRFLFEPADDTLIAQVRAKIEEQIRLWEPRVVIEQIEITTNPNASELDMYDDLTERGQILLIKILFYDPDNIKEIQQLALEVPLGAG